MPAALFSCFKQRSHLSDSPPRMRLKALQRRLDSAERVNLPTTLDSMTIEYLHIHNILPEALGDGLWKCCCGYENELAHWTGSHPFKHVYCYRCNHILCRECCTTDAFAPLEKVTERFYQWRGAVNLAPFGQVCPDCGLTHRVRIPRTTNVYSQRPLDFTGIVCACGRHSDGTWLRFRIGSIEEYRKNPHSAFAEVNIQRAEKSVHQQIEGIDRDNWIRTTEIEDTPPPYRPPEDFGDAELPNDLKDPVATTVEATLPCDLKRRGAVRYSPRL